MSKTYTDTDFPTCDFQFAAGDRCGKSAGWGTEHVGEGYCKYHDGHLDAENDEAKIKYLEAYPIFMVRGAAATEAGVALSTIWRWRQRDSAFDRMCRDIEEVYEPMAVAEVEDNLFFRVKTGEASAAETIFWLCNRASARWRDVKHIEQTVKSDLLETLRAAWDARKEADELPEFNRSDGEIAAIEPDRGTKSLLPGMIDVGEGKIISMETAEGLIAALETPRGAEGEEADPLLRAKQQNLGIEEADSPS